MHRFHFAALDRARPGESIELSGDEAHHLLAVRRVRRGERVLLFDGRGVEALAELLDGERRRGHPVATLRVTAVEPRGAPPLRVTLAVSPPKGKRMALLVEKATELGAARILPLRLSRTPRADPDPDRWRRIALEAAKQCMRPLLPEIEAPRDLATVLGEPFDLRLVLDLAPGASRLLDALPEEPGSILVVVGPEGGLTAGEREAAGASGCVPVRIAPDVLRVETAAIAALSAIAARYA